MKTAYVDFIFKSVRHEKTRQNQAGGDTSQITDFTQTWHKCWVCWVNDYGKNLG